jgi:hypothetical protein
LPLLFLFDASSICLWQLLNVLCALNVWLAFGVGLVLTAQTHKERFEIIMVVGMWGCVLGCDVVQSGILEMGRGATFLPTVGPHPPDCDLWPPILSPDQPDTLSYLPVGRRNEQCYVWLREFLVSWILKLQIAVRQRLLSFGAEYLIFQFAIQKFKDQDVQNCNFASCSVWLWNLVSHIEGGT